MARTRTRVRVRTILVRVRVRVGGKSSSSAKSTPPTGAPKAAETPTRGSWVRDRIAGKAG